MKTKGFFIHSFSSLEQIPSQEWKIPPLVSQVAIVWEPQGHTLLQTVERNSRAKSHTIGSPGTLFRGVTWEGGGVLDRRDFLFPVTLLRVPDVDGGSVRKVVLSTMAKKWVEIILEISILLLSLDAWVQALN